jgi:hypothetical protein
MLTHTKDAQTVTAQPRLALMIDGDTVQASAFPHIISSVMTFGLPIVRRLYGDWRKQYLKGWEGMQAEYGLKLIQHSAQNTPSGNATEQAMTIDAMDILYQDVIDGFCIVSYSSDFSGLASRLSEGGKLVVGYGDRQTPKIFTRTSHHFIYFDELGIPSLPATPAPEPAPIETLVPDPEPAPIPASTPKPIATTPASVPDPEPVPVATTPQSAPTAQILCKDDLYLFQQAFEDAKLPNGWANPGDLGNALKQRGFSYKSLGFPRLIDFLQAFPEWFELENMFTANGHISQHVRMKKPKKS